MLLGVRWNSLRTKIITWSFVPAMLILSVTAVVALISNDQVTQALSLTSNHDYVRLAAMQFQSELSVFEHTLDSTSRLAGLQTGSPTLQQAALRKDAAALRIFDGGVLIINSMGRVTAAQGTDGDWINRNLADQPFYRKITDNPRFTIWQYAEEMPGMPRFVVMAVPVINNRGEHAGALAGLFHLGSHANSAFYSAIDQLGISAAATAYLVDGQGFVVYHTDPSNTGQDFALNPSAQAALKRKSGAQRLQRADGHAVLVAYAPVPNTPWVMVVEKSWLSLLAPGRPYTAGLLALLVLGIFVPSAVLAVGVGRITRPVQQLSAAARRMADGNLDTRITINTGDEIEELGQQFNKMGSQLEHLYQVQHQANRSLRALSECNQALVRASDETSLLNEICRIIVEHGGYRMAWVGYCADDDSCTVIPIARAGYDNGYVDQAAIRYDDSERGRGPIGTAIRSGRPAVVQDVAEAGQFQPWCEEARRRGYLGVIALPLFQHEQILGAITIYAGQADAFTEAETNLLIEFARDLSYGIGALRAKVELDHHREHLEELVIARTAQLDQLNQDLVMAKERAEEADHLKSAFLATMSHELRTPLNSILGFTGVILQGLAGPLNEEQTKQLGFVRTSARHLLDLINDILDVSKIEAGQLKLNAGPFDVVKSINKVITLVSPLAQKKNLPLIINTPESVEIIHDQRRFEQVLINLVNNAIKFTEQGHIEVICEQRDERVLLAVRDTGIGIPATQLETVFRPFHQVDTGLTRRYEGTGLGLSISHKLTEIMGGSLAVESQSGVGTTFTLALPLEYQEVL